VREGQLSGPFVGLSPALFHFSETLLALPVRECERGQLAGDNEIWDGKEREIAVGTLRARPGQTARGKHRSEVGSPSCDSDRDGLCSEFSMAPVMKSSRAVSLVESVNTFSRKGR
jgi:hypothetical protein